MDEQRAYGQVSMNGRRGSVDIELASHVVDELMRAADEQSVLETVTRHGYDGVRPPQAALAARHDDRMLHLVAGISVPDPIRDSFPMPIDAPRPLPQALAEGVSIWIESAADRDRWYPALTDFTDLPKSGGFLPLDLAHGMTAVLAVLFEHDRSISEGERSYYELLAKLCALALDRLALAASNSRRS